MPESLRKLIPLLSQVPLLGGLFFWSEVARKHPVYAILIIIVYEIGLFILAFSKKVWARLEDKAIQQTADWILGGIQLIAPGFRRRYKSQVIRDYGIFNVRGLGLINTYTLSLDQVFVDLRIDASNPQRFNVDPLQEKALAGSRQVWDFLKIENIEHHQAAGLAIIGPPGCGKTTLLQHLALTFASNRQRRYRLRSFSPVLLFLRDHITSITQEQPPTLGYLADDFFGDKHQFPTLRTPARWFSRQLEKGRCIVLLDGLDEVADLEQRKTVSTWVDRQIRTYNQCPFVLTARPQGYRDAPLQRAHVLEVQPFSQRQVRKFIENWYLSNEIISSGNQDTPDVRNRAARDAENLLNRLRKTPALHALTVNPLLLTMIAMVHRYHGALPGSRVELYADICEVLLGRWRQAKGISDTLSAAQKLVILRPLAAHMMERKCRDVAISEAMEVITTPLRRVGIANKLAASFLSDLQAHSGLLLEREAGQWSFAHLTFQEYLTAAYWLEQKTIKDNWNEFVDDSWWHETLRLYAAQGDASGLVKACLNVDSLPALTLAADCLTEARELDIELRRDIEHRVITGVNSDDADRRRLAAQVRLARRLRELHYVDDKCEIDLEYLSCAEYQLFLDDMRSQGKYYQPDHWKEFSFEKEHGLDPITGVRGEDANAYCKWLTQLYGGGTVKYRLPTPLEGVTNPSELSTIGTWCVEGNSNRLQYTLVGLSDTAEQQVLAHLLDLFGTSKRVPLLSNLNPGVLLNFSGRTGEQRESELDFKIELLHRGLKYALGSNSPLELKIGLNNGYISATSLQLYVFRQHLNLALARDLDKSVGMDPRLMKQMPSIRDMACNLAATLSTDFTTAVEAINRGDLPAAIENLQILENYTETAKSQMASILVVVASLSPAENIPISVARTAQRISVLQTLEQTELGPYLLDVWWSMKILMAREAGKLSSWEGIRIVREQLPKESSYTTQY